jgi:acetylglutamate kinase
LNKITVVKIGGSTLGATDTTFDDVVSLQKQGKPVVVIHGGGKLITDWLKKIGVASRFVQGERVTDAPTLEVVISVLAGLVNKDIVTSINARGGRAVGISGVDGDLIKGRIGDPEKGYVGVVKEVNGAILTSLLEAGFVPIVAPVGVNLDRQTPSDPACLNFNADVIAGEIAAAVSAERLVFLTDVTGIMDQSKNLITRVSASEARNLLASGVASGGMIPKVQACLRALSSSEATCIVDGREEHALKRAIEVGDTGTVFSR